MGIISASIFLFGLIAFFTDAFNYHLYTYLKPLDSIALIEAGIIVGILAIEPAKQPSLSLARLLAIPVLNASVKKQRSVVS
jgi:hypothetical protein